MFEENEQDISELDIEARTWNKLETAMKLLGFREGAAEGKNLSMQEGFNSGYFDGFKLGEYLGMAKGIINCEAELKLSPNINPHFEEELNKFSSQPCALCLEEKDSKTPSNNTNWVENSRNLITTQQIFSNKIISTIKSSDLEPYFDKG